MKSIKMDSDETRQHIANLSRSPFRDLVARLLACQPTDDALVHHAEKNPDRWAQTLAIAARLAGFTDKLEVEGSLVHRVEALSDSQLDQRLRVLEAEAHQVDMQSSGHLLVEPAHAPVKDNAACIK